MPKFLEDSLGSLEYLLLGLTFLGVLYLVMKQANISVSLSKDSFAGNHGIRFLTEDDAGNRAGWYPKQHGYEGMSLSSHEPPVWNATPHDSNELDLVAFEKAASEVDYGTVGKAAQSQNEGMNTYARKAVESMDNKLTTALLGGNAGLQ
jgi:hypothetical protein